MGARPSKQQIFNIARQTDNTITLAGTRKTGEHCADLTFHLQIDLSRNSLYAEESDNFAPLELAAAMYKERRLRETFFRGDLFGEPGWDILLDIFIHDQNGPGVSVTSACIGANVPGTTALRWISILVDEDLLTRKSDGTDGRRTFVKLTEKGRAALSNYMAAVTAGRRT